MKILPSLTTTRTVHTSSTWREKIQEIKDLKLEEIALFVTAIGLAERQELYKMLEETSVKSIPFVHLRTDMSPAEIEQLFNRYDVKAANIHCRKFKPLKYDLSQFKAKIFMENCDEPIADEIGDWAGLCLDVSHHENKRLTGNELYGEVEELLKKYPIGAWHLNAVRSEMEIDPDDGIGHYDHHFYKDLSEFDYCRRYNDYLPQTAIAMELENSIADQLKAIEYVKKILAL